MIKFIQVSDFTCSTTGCMIYIVGYQCAVEKADERKHISYIKDKKGEILILEDYNAVIGLDLNDHPSRKIGEAETCYESGQE